MRGDARAAPRRRRGTVVTESARTCAIQFVPAGTVDPQFWLYKIGSWLHPCLKCEEEEGDEAKMGTH